MLFATDASIDRVTDRGQQVTLVVPREMQMEVADNASILDTMFPELIICMPWSQSF